MSERLTLRLKRYAVTRHGRKTEEGSDSGHKRDGDGRRSGARACSQLFCRQFGARL